MGLEMPSRKQSGPGHPASIRFALEQSQAELRPVGIAPGDWQLSEERNDLAKET